jgi:hypothetical protein
LAPGSSDRRQTQLAVARQAAVGAVLTSALGSSDKQLTQRVLALRRQTARPQGAVAAGEGAAAVIPARAFPATSILRVLA